MAKCNLFGIRQRINSLRQTEFKMRGRHGRLDPMRLALLRGEKSGLRLRLRDLQRTRTRIQRSARKRARRFAS